MPDSAETPPESDDVLLQRATAGDGDACARLIARHRDYLRQVAAIRFDPRLRPRVDESDLVQEALVEATRGAQSYLAAPALPVRLWLRRLLFDALVAAQRRHLGADCRAAGREVELSAESCVAAASRLVHPDPTPGTAAARRELGEQVRAAVTALAADDREVIVLRLFEQLTNVEAASVLNLTPEATSKRFARALLRLRGELTARGIRGGSA